VLLLCTSNGVKNRIHLQLCRLRWEAYVDGMGFQKELGS
jgi:hypothetical protein